MRDPGLRSNRAVELRVGLLVLLSAVLLVWGVFWLSDTTFGGGGLSLYGITPDAQLITKGSRVYLRGVDVGSVSRVELHDKYVVLKLDVRYDGRLPDDTRGIIQSSGFLGNQMIVLLPGGSSTYLADADTVQLSGAAGLEAIAGELGDQAADVLGRAAELFSDQTIADIHRSSSAFAGAMDELQGLVEEQRSTIGDLLANLNETAGQLRAATEGPELESAVARLDSITSRLRSASAGLDSTSHSLASITRKMDEGEGTLGLLVNDKQLYVKISAAMENIQVASEEIALLTKDLRERPERYLQGLKVSVF